MRVANYVSKREPKFAYRLIRMKHRIAKLYTRLKFNFPESRRYATFSPGIAP